MASGGSKNSQLTMAPDQGAEIGDPLDATADFDLLCL
jgi:hypothetical protein